MRKIDELITAARKIKFEGGAAIPLTFAEFSALDQVGRILSVRHPAMMCAPWTDNFFEGLKVVPREAA
jgi:hypothetical protein